MNNKKFSEKAIRHGEVMIIPVDEIPADAEQIYSGKQYVIGHSETGHHHVAVATIPNAITIYRPAGADDQRLYMRVTGDAKVEHRKTHDKHETKTLFEGNYIVSIKNAYDYFKKAMTKV